MIAPDTNATNHLEDTAIHDWYRFVLAFPDHLVANYLDKFGIEAGATVLDPFVGTGTTLVECKKRSVHSIGMDANPVTAFASRVKTQWEVDLNDVKRRRDLLLKRLRPALLRLTPVGGSAQLSFDDLGLLRETATSYPALARTTPEEIIGLIPKGAISPVPLSKTLIVRDAILEQPADDIRDLFLLAFASAVLNGISNLSFGPEVYVSKQREDADVYHIFSERLENVVNDLETIQPLKPFARSQVFCDDARVLSNLVADKVDAVITSPPYPNEKDYTRITRLEMVLLGFIRDKKDLRQLKDRILRSNTRNIFVKDDDGQYVSDIGELRRIAAEIERRRKEKGANSGFEKLYHRVVLEYFGGMYRVLGELERVMRRGARAAIVVGDQMSYFRVPIKTAELLAQVVEVKSMRFRVVNIEEFRTRWATATKKDISETVLILARK
jgi:hypothetical protein